MQEKIDYLNKILNKIPRWPSKLYYKEKKLIIYVDERPAFVFDYVDSEFKLIKSIDDWANIAWFPYMNSMMDFSKSVNIDELIRFFFWWLHYQKERIENGDW